MANCEKSPSPKEQQVRLMIWTTPRTTSTALTKCLSFVKDSKVFFEPYLTAYFMGPDKSVSPNERGDSYPALKEEFVGWFDASQCTYKWVKEQLEGTHDGKKFILCKDMAYTVSDRFAFLPENYQHLVLIRNPLKVFPSWKILFRQIRRVSMDEYELDKLPPGLFPEGRGYKEINDLIEYLKETRNQEVIIIDADDLLQDPKGILSALFKVIGMPFEERLLSWEAGDAITREWVVAKHCLEVNQVGHMYNTAFDSTCFTKPRPLPDRRSLSPDILRCVDASIPYYNKMHARRLTAEK
ncbi:branched-chain-amino-acid aminotransferase-like protein 2 [Patiria miniata]|uniref:Sulfotransferase family protein n=1 Tax=Patiria miniata TaxID=46514 RepID=A0A914B229_PATMI|nr:branched-chain-amino-acid aminotransferase-like protein 2 [Patiria miniata]